MIVTTDLGLRYHVEELARGKFSVHTINPEDGPRLNPWTGKPVRLPTGLAPALTSLTLKIGAPLAFRQGSCEQIPPSELEAEGYADHNRITAIEP